MMLKPRSSIHQLVRAVRDWPVSSQQTARRNALVRSTDLTRLRGERAEIDAYVEAALARRAVRATRETAARPA